MFLSDLISILQWWATIFFVGIVFVPITSLIFPNFFDKGYVFAKIIGIAFISYAVFILGFLKILPFTEATIILASLFFLILNLVLISKYPNIPISIRKSWKIFFFEEILFLGVLFFWSFIHAHQPDIHGLEKYMDFGFINSILRTKYFPPLDMWFTPYSINYYYFGHLVTAVLTKLSGIPSSITFNLMLSTIAALSFTAAFSIGANLLSKLDAALRLPFSSIQGKRSGQERFTLYAGGIITAFLLNFAGSLHTIYLFFKPYINENPVPFWNLIFSPQTFPNSYWYPNATRFIPNTIHEFPIYSSVVSDLHGHVLDIPFVLLTIAVLLSLLYQHVILKPKGLKDLDSSLHQVKLGFVQNDIMMIPLISFLLAVMYMTNAWDGIIYFILTIFIFSYLIFKQLLYSENLKSQNSKHKNTTQISKLYNLLNPSFIFHLSSFILILGIGFFIFILPFNINFKPFASGIGILCAPNFLTDLGRFGPFIFEVNHCQNSPLWQLFALYGFFYFWVISFFVFLLRFVILSRAKLSEGSRKILRFAQNDIMASDVFVGILIILSTILIVIPEFVYVKDIYPTHYRANTMFKLVYQSFIMLSLSSGFIIVRLFLNQKFKYWLLGYWVIGLLVLFLVLLYPYFAINSYFGSLKTYQGLNGTKYLRALYPNDYEAILWINKNVKGQPIILEAQGDSYTDYGRVSANTGLPTVLGWTVHEWLWRGTYDIPAPRITEVVKMYESQDIGETRILLKKYNVSLVFIGNLERQKYPNLNEEKFQSLGEIIYQKGDTKIFEIHVR